MATVCTVVGRDKVKHISFFLRLRLRIAGSCALRRSLARCWIIAAVFAGLMYLFVANDQGREALLVAVYEAAVLILFMVGFIAMMTAYILARLSIEVGRLSAGDVAEVFARDVAPQLVAILCAFSLPLCLGFAGTDSLRRDPNVRLLSIFFVAISLMSVFFGWMLSKMTRSRIDLQRMRLVSEVGSDLRVLMVPENTGSANQ